MKGVILFSLLFVFISTIIAQNEIRDSTIINIFFIKENCEDVGFSICFDGVEQIVRSQSNCYILDSLSVINLEYKNIFKIGKLEFCENTQFTLFPFDTSEFSYMPIVIDSFLNEQSNITNQKIIYNKKLKKKVNRMFKKYNLNNHFDGNLKFNLFEGEMVLRYVGMQRILIPNMESKRRSILYDFIDIPSYQVARIIKIRPCKL